MDEYDRSLPQAYPNMLCNLEKQVYTYYIIKEYGPHTSWMPAELIFGEKATHTCNKMKSDKTKSTPNHSPPPALLPDLVHLKSQLLLLRMLIWHQSGQIQLQMQQQEHTCSGVLFSESPCN